MPLRCLDPDRGASVLAFDLSPASWRTLESENRRRRHLRMPCCLSEVVLRRSKLGLPHFVHKATGTCTAEPETEAHLCLKLLAVEAARAHGWEALTEAAGQAPSGEMWRADVLANKGQAQVAIEIQWSQQSDRETVRRQERYRLSGVRGLWLFRQASFPLSGDLPAARVLGTPQQGFTAALAGPAGGQRLPVADFLHAAFHGRLRFSLPLGVKARVTIRTGRLHCWSCQSETVILREVDVQAGPHGTRLDAAVLDQNPELWDGVRRLLPGSHPLAASQAQGWARPSCGSCGRAFSAFDAQHAWHGQTVLSEAEIRLDEPWRDVLCRRGTPPANWGVF